jgi:hypothetical protein
MDAVVVSYKNPWFFFSHLFGNRKGEKAKANSTFSPLSLLDRFIYSAVLMVADFLFR